MKDIPIWLDGIRRKKYDILKSDIECDILIIGAGITGISCAYFLKNSNEKIIVVEANKVCTGTTAKSTGKLTYLQEDYLNKINEIYDQETMLKYVDSQKEAIKLAKKIIIDNDIKCNLDPVTSYIFTNNHLNKFKIYKICDCLKNGNVKITKNLPLKVNYVTALHANDTYVFHPVKFVLGLANCLSRNTTIYEKTRVLNMDKKNNYYLARTKNGTIRAKKVIFACHYPFFIIPYFFPFKTAIEKSFLVASEMDKINKISAINIDKNVLSFRHHKDKKNYFIMVNSSSDLHKNINDIKKRNNIIWNMRSHYSPKIKYCWSNHDIMTFDHMPLIGEIDKNLFLASGYNTWGMTNGILAGKIISDLIMGNDNEYKKLFDPLRDFKNIPNLLKNNMVNTIGLIESKIIKNKDFYDKRVKIISENGITYGIYIDEKNIEHKVLNLCPHMKCNLYFNYQTKTWDCPCHGSSFDIDGNVLLGPATYDIKIKKNSK